MEQENAERKKAEERAAKRKKEQELAKQKKQGECFLATVLITEYECCIISVKYTKQPWQYLEVIA